MSEAAAGMLQALRLRGGFEKVKESELTGQYRILGRVKQETNDAWLLLVTRLLIASERTEAWSVDISKQYFVQGGKLMYGWRLIVQSRELATAYSDIAELATSAPRVKATIAEQPLVGARRSPPSASNNGKGAQSVYSAVVGPKALTRMGN